MINNSLMQSRTIFQFEERCSSILDLIVIEGKKIFESYKTTPKRKRPDSPMKDLTNIKKMKL